MDTGINAETDDNLLLDDESPLDLSTFPEPTLSGSLEHAERVFGKEGRERIQELMALPEHADKGVYDLFVIVDGERYAKLREQYPLFDGKM